MAYRFSRKMIPASQLQPGGDTMPPWVRMVADRSDLRTTDRPQIMEPADVAQLVADIAFAEVEHVVVLTLDSKGRVIRRHEVTRGIADSSLVHPREVFRAAIADAAIGIVIAHNHPGGDPTPSQADRAVTRALVEAGRLLDLPVFDHIIVAHDQWLSFSGTGLL